MSMENDGLKIDIETPLKLEPHQVWVCNYLDRLNENAKFCSDGTLPSNLIKGALAVAKNTESNPDWMAQSAHSYREILYWLGGKKNLSFYIRLKIKTYSLLIKLGIKNKSICKSNNFQTKKEKIGNVLLILHEQERASSIADVLYKTHVAFTKISHHFAEKNSKEATIKIFRKLKINVSGDVFPSQKDFNSLVQVFENTLKAASLDPLDIHKKIDVLIKNENKDESHLRLLLSLNYDAKRFFFSQADDTWIDWLWKNGFLDAIKNKSKDITSISYHLPELDYLTRMAEKEPAQVAKIMRDKNTATTKENFNPEVVGRFLWILNTLPAEQITTLTAKIRDERWTYLMRDFNKSGYEFTKIVEKLVKSKQSSALLELAQTLFAIKNKEEVAKTSFFTDSPFYINDIQASGIFEALADIEESCAEKALEITTGIMRDIVKLAEPDDTKVFDYIDDPSFYDVDFFHLPIQKMKSVSYREDINNLAAVITQLIKRTVGAQCGNIDEARRLFTYIDKIPLSRSMWRLRLFALAQCPTVFKEELRKAILRLFAADNYYEIVGGREYKTALKILFPHLSGDEQRAYVTQVFSYFTDRATQNPDQAWHKRTGGEILSNICVYLTDDEFKKCEDVFGIKPDVEYMPEPLSGQIRGGTVRHMPPVNIEDYTIIQIIENLKSEWTPKRLNEQFKNDDFLSPRGVEGLGDALKENIKMRTDDYLALINAFFDREAIHPHYLYSLLRGLEEMFRNGNSLSMKQIGQIFGLFDAIKKEGEKAPFKKSDDKSWLVDWIGVHRVLADVLVDILQNTEINKAVFATHRETIKNIISYLFTITDSPSKEDEKPEDGELYHIAINSVRGRAYEAFVLFTEHDGKTLAADTKDIYKKALHDDSLVIRFVIGRYLASFYFREKEFIVGIFPEIFPTADPEKKDIYLATWEGYLSSSLYDKLFVELEPFYRYAIALDPKEYTKRTYVKGEGGLDQLLAIHLALAFAHLGLGIESDLFQLFWGKPNTTRHHEFISFIGRSCLTRDQAGDVWLEENKVSKEKLIAFWKWVLKNPDITDPKVFTGFGFWINPDKEILEDTVIIEMIAETLVRSNGDIDWDYGLLKRLPIFAEKNGEKTLAIISSYLLDSQNNLNPNRRFPFFDQTGIKEALRTIYKGGNTEVKQKVADLINTLIEKGSSTFWGLKDVIDLV